MPSQFELFVASHQKNCRGSSFIRCKGICTLSSSSFARRFPSLKHCDCLLRLISLRYCRQKKSSSSTLVLGFDTPCRIHDFVYIVFVERTVQKHFSHASIGSLIYASPEDTSASKYKTLHQS